jgi:hypothetical protein
MSLDSTISLEVGEASDFVVDGCHDRHDAGSREHSMSPSTILNVGGPAFSGAEIKYCVKINLFVSSELRQTFHSSSIAPVVSQLTTVVMVWDLKHLFRTPARSSREPSRSSSPLTRTRSRGPARQVRRCPPLYRQPPPRQGQSQP